MPMSVSFSISPLKLDSARKGKEPMHTVKDLLPWVAITSLSSWQRSSTPYPECQVPGFDDWQQEQERHYSGVKKQKQKNTVTMDRLNSASLPSVFIQVILCVAILTSSYPIFSVSSIIALQSRRSR